jgi:hypothetical protein
MLNLEKTEVLSGENHPVHSRFTPCAAGVSLLEAVRGASENFRMNLPGGFLRKSPGRNNQQPNEIQLLKERTRQRQTK